MCGCLGKKIPKQIKKQPCVLLFFINCTNIKSLYNSRIQEAQQGKGQEDLKHMWASRVIILFLVLRCRGMFYHAITFLLVTLQCHHISPLKSM